MSMSDSALICYRRAPGDELFFAVNDSEEIYCFSTKEDAELQGYYVAHYLTEAISETCAKRSSPTNTNGPGVMWTWDLYGDEEYAIGWCRNFSQSLKDFVAHRLDLECGKECVICGVATHDESVGHIDDYGGVWCYECCCGRYCYCCEGHYDDEHDLTYVSETSSAIGHTGTDEGHVCRHCLDSNYEEWDVPMWDEQSQLPVAEELGSMFGNEWLMANPKCKPDPTISDIHQINAEAFFDESGKVEEAVGYEWESPCLRRIFVENWVWVCTTHPPGGREPQDKEETNPNQLTLADLERAKPEHREAVTGLVAALRQVVFTKQVEEEKARRRRESHKACDLAVMASGLERSLGENHPNYIPY